jgi:hypothetical protein
MVRRHTADPGRYSASGQESHYIRREVITVEFDQMVGVWVILLL